MNKIKIQIECEEENAEEIRKELKKTLRRWKRLLDDDLGYEYRIIRKH